MTEEQLKAAAEKRAETRQKREEAIKRAYGLDKDQRDHLATYLLEESRERRLSVVEMVMETWAQGLTDDDLKLKGRMRKKVDYRRRLEWVRDYFGTRFEREGQPRFRQAKLSAVIGALVKFCLSAGDRDKSQEADLGLFTLTADAKTGEALLALSQEGEAVAITETGYNKAQELLRKMSEEFGDEMLDGRKLADLVAEVREGLKQVGKAGPVAPDLKGVKTYKEKQEIKRRKEEAVYRAAAITGEK